MRGNAWIAPGNWESLGSDTRAQGFEGRQLRFHRPQARLGPRHLLAQRARPAKAGHEAGEKPSGIPKACRDGIEQSRLWHGQGLSARQGRAIVWCGYGGCRRRRDGRGGTDIGRRRPERHWLWRRRRWRQGLWRPGRGGSGAGMRPAGQAAVVMIAPRRGGRIRSAGNAGASAFAAGMALVPRCPRRAAAPHAWYSQIVVMCSMWPAWRRQRGDCAR